MNKTPAKHKQVLSLTSPSKRCCTMKDILKNGKQNLHNNSSSHPNTPDHHFVQFSKGNTIDLAKMGRNYMCF